MAFDFEFSSSQSLTGSLSGSISLPFCISAWIKTESLGSGIQRAIVSLPTSVSRYELRIETNTGYVVAAHGGNGALSSIGHSVGTIIHACAVYTSNSSRSAYINGGNKGSSTGTSSAIAPTTVRVGVGGSFATPADHFDGIIDNIAIINGTVTDAQVALLAKGIHPLAIFPESSLLEQWNFIDGNLRGRKGTLLTNNAGTVPVNSFGKVYFIPSHKRFKASLFDANAISNAGNGSIVLAGQPISANPNLNKSSALTNGLINILGQQIVTSNSANKTVNTVFGLIDILGNSVTATNGLNKTSALANGDVTVIGHQPTSSASNNQPGNQTSNIAAGLLTVIGQLPLTVNSNNKTANTISGVLNLQGNSPQITWTQNKTVSTVEGLITFHANTPTITRSANKTANPFNGLLGMEGFAVDTVTIKNKSVNLSAGAINLLAYQPGAFVLGSFFPPPINRLVKVTKSNRIIRVM